MKNKKSWFSFKIFFLVLGCINKQSDELKSGFKNPPDSAKPCVYWYLMDGNLSREEMTKDMESMKKVGLICINNNPHFMKFFRFFAHQFSLSSSSNLSASSCIAVVFDVISRYSR